ncbi:MAG: MmgE/PrpD family protein, partial [Deltaproteobacteria bacterium]|nr:MmgE/PrpD family protein [Candidatus Tharpella sp.]
KRGKLRLEDFAKKQIEEPDILKLVKKITVSPARELAENDINSISINVTTRDGNNYKTNRDKLLGSPAAPMSSRECREKFNDCISFSNRDDIGQKSAAIIEQVLNLEEIDNLQQLTSLL